MRISSHAMVVSWIPKGSMPFPFRLPFDIGVTKYDPEPPKTITDIDEYDKKNACRCINLLEVSVEVKDSQIVSAEYQGERLMSTTTVDAALAHAELDPIEFPILQDKVEFGKDYAKFVQTVGGHAGLPVPRFVSNFPFVTLTSPTIWSTLALTVYADGRSEIELVDSSSYPCHWIYNENNEMIKQGAPMKYWNWWSENFALRSPWSEDVKDAVITDVHIKAGGKSAVVLMGDEVKEKAPRG